MYSIFYNILLSLERAIFRTLDMSVKSKLVKNMIYYEFIK